MGALIERSPGVWQLRVRLPADPITGERKRVTRTVHGGKRAAQEQLAEMEAEIRRGARRRRDATLEVAIREWREHADHAPGTAQNYDRAVRTIPSKLRRTTINELDSRLLRRFVDQVVVEHGAHRGRLVHALLSGALRHAWEQEWITANPMARVRVPRAPERADTTPDAAAVVELLELVRDDLELHAWLLCLVDLGARRGEVLALRWSAIDLDQGRVRIRTTLDPVLHTEKDPKARQRRTVAIGPNTVTALRRWRSATRERALAAGVGLVDDPFVFMSPSDHSGATPWRPDLGTRRFRRLADQVGLTDVRQHDLRHHVATVLLAAGVDAKTVAGRLGHTRVATTTDRYAHALPAPDRAAADVLAQLHTR
jgi:integrase